MGSLQLYLWRPGSWELLPSVTEEGHLSDPWFLDLMVDNDVSFTPTWGETDPTVSIKGEVGGTAELACPSDGLF